MPFVDGAVLDFWVCWAHLCGVPPGPWPLADTNSTHNQDTGCAVPAQKPSPKQYTEPKASLVNSFHVPSDRDPTRINPSSFNEVGSCNHPQILSSKVWSSPFWWTICIKTEPDLKTAELSSSWVTQKGEAFSRFWALGGTSTFGQFALKHHRRRPNWLGFFQIALESKSNMTLPPNPEFIAPK